MKTKTEKAIELYQSGNFTKALAIFKTFRLNLTKEERDTLITTHEFLNGSEAFYTQMGYNIEELEKQSKQIIENKLIK